MSVVHLSDSDIQEYLDTNSNNEKVEKHILGCEDCALLLAEYQSFYTILEADETPKLSVDFVNQTMFAVKQEAIILDSNKGLYLYSIVSLFSVVAFLKYYVGFDFSIFKFELPSVSNVFANWTIFSTASHYYQTSASTVNVLLFAGFILLFFALVDSIMSRRSLGNISSFSL